MKGTEPTALGTRTSTPPVRIVHLGLGAFHRSHQAWYTASARDADEWGIASYSGRSSDLAEALTAQDGLYTLVVRSSESDRAERVDSIVRAHAGTDLSRFLADVAAPTTAIVSLTITEAAYSDEATIEDRSLLADLGSEDELASTQPVSALGRLVLGLEARRRVGSPALAIVSCDNVPDNGGVLQRAVAELTAVAPVLADWVDRHVSFVSSSVDRITPRLSPEDAAELQRRYGDRAPVVTEPFADWVLFGEFPAGRPDWESAGARIVDELEPWEARKLWLLNGAHTLLAALGALRGHDSVAAAIADPECRAAVDDYWDEACRHLPDGLALAEYRAALLERFANPRIVHRLEQIAEGVETKIALRIVPVALRERRAGRSARASATVIAAWIAASGAEEGIAAVRSEVGRVSDDLASDDEFVLAVLHVRADLDILALR